MQELGKVRQEVRLVKEINKMIVKRKAWVWVWAIDKAVDMTSKMRVEVWTLSHRIAVNKPIKKISISNLELNLRLNT